MGKGYRFTRRPLQLALRNRARTQHPNKQNFFQLLHFNPQIAKNFLHPTSLPILVAAFDIWFFQLHRHLQHEPDDIFIRNTSYPVSYGKIDTRLTILPISRSQRHSVRESLYWPCLTQTSDRDNFSWPFHSCSICPSRLSILWSPSRMIIFNSSSLK